MIRFIWWSIVENLEALDGGYELSVRKSFDRDCISFFLSILIKVFLWSYWNKLIILCSISFYKLSTFKENQPNTLSFVIFLKCYLQCCIYHLSLYSFSDLLIKCIYCLDRFIILIWDLTAKSFDVTISEQDFKF